ncbi:ParM/StbA family protein [Leptolyngbya sp. GGD]|uniref:ParM/StbA family protein n=1 Tax=Leptolyngbya sp. GGD TaxID=2997907 RepID=UPI00227A0DA8|nr:hypothetical protein [Leptolyngbya sp. GGD]MCY6491920.1 hypothetical protein [Leptolyngbya sp. GGD]
MARTIIAGVDTGNWKEKIVYSEVSKKKSEPKQISMRSAIDLVDSDYPNAITCASQFSHWNNQSWIDCSDGDEEVMNIENGKAHFALPVLISAMWDVLKDGDNLKLAVSVPRKDLHGKSIESALNGVHSFTCNGVTKRIDIEVLSTFHEGVGVILDERPQAKKVYLMEIGGGTINVSAFDKLKVLCDPYIAPNCGSRTLINELANCTEAVQAVGKVGGLSKETSVNILEKPGHTVSGLNNFSDFSSVVEREVHKWLDRVLPDLEKRTMQHLEQTDMKLASGGSCLIPAVRRYLEAKGFTIVSDPQWANAKGLHARAVWMFQSQAEAA